MSVEPKRPFRLHTLSLATVLAFVLVGAAGCSRNPYFFASPNGAAWQVPATAAADPTQAQIVELNRRVQLLDDNNRQLTTQLAQSAQQAQAYRDENELYRKQLADMTERLESATAVAKNAQDQVRGMQASSRVRGGASIQANTNLVQLASRLNLGGLAAEQDGQVVRIIVPADRLFQPGTAQLQPQAAGTLDPVAAQLRSVFPRQRIGVESYTDNAQLYGGTVATSHQLTSAQATAVLDLLTRRSGLPPQQLFTVAQGSNNPRQSNDTAAGRAANRRVELVIYPDTF
ncbi:MAG: OmpA family protein [Pirellulales bacterium]|nr:OmpA family protein [Pirellulales bacterium]